MIMKNKFKVAAIVVVVVIGMALYKERFDRLENEEESKDKKKSARANNHGWN